MNIGDRCDDALMYCINKTVHAYNWTTGKQKADLANTLHTGGTMLMTGGIISFAPWVGFVSTPMFFLALLELRKRNVKHQNLENEALESSTLLSPKKYERFKRSGYLQLGLGGVSATPIFNIEENPYFNEIISSGAVIDGIAYHIMRAENLPPRRSVFRRAKDSLDALVTKPSHVYWPE